MTLPANIRVNGNVPFPSFVLALGPITITKTNGVWTIGFSMANLAIQTPSPAQQITDYVLVWDSVAKTFFQMQLSLLVGAKMQRLITGSGSLPIAATDALLNLNINTSLAITLPSAASRAGVALTFKDVAGTLSNSVVATLTAAGGDTIDGQATLAMKTARQGVTLVPANDGTSTGWFVE